MPPMRSAAVLVLALGAQAQDPGPVSLTDTLTPLIPSASDFIGRDTGKSVALQRGINRDSVPLGPLIITGEATPDQIPAKAK